MRPALSSARRCTASAIAAITVFGALDGARATTAALEPVRDATLYDSVDGSVANGSGQYAFVGRNSGGNTRRTLMAFDIAGVIPGGSTITAVTLDVSVISTSGGATGVTLHRVLTDWSEGPSDPDGTEGGGAAAQPGDSTWLHTFYDTSLWGTPGGDFDPIVSGTTVIDQPGAYTFASALGMVADVQAWLDDPSSNFGWIVLGDESGPGTAKRFGTHENPDGAVRPRLTITYTIPAPAPACVVAAFGATLFVRRRRPRG